MRRIYALQEAKRHVDDNDNRKLFVVDRKRDRRAAGDAMDEPEVIFREPNVGDWAQLPAKYILYLVSEIFFLFLSAFLGGAG